MSVCRLDQPCQFCGHYEHPDATPRCCAKDLGREVRRQNTDEARAVATGATASSPSVVSSGACAKTPARAGASSKLLKRCSAAATVSFGTPSLPEPTANLPRSSKRSRVLSIHPLPLPSPTGRQRLPLLLPAIALAGDALSTCIHIVRTIP